MEALTQLLQVALAYGKTIRITDLIDISIIAYLIYRLMLLARKSNSAQVVKGVLLLLVVLWASYQFHLNVLSFLLGKTVELGFVALVIVFQPEIRRFLGQMGSNGLSAVFRSPVNDEPEELENAITQTVEAYAQLSRDKVGALIVFERKIILDDCLKTGTALDCSVSAELLKNLFWNKAPLHDGAVIVRDGRIVGAGCMLPMSGNVNISRELGMRHRAGIGISESSDAVVAIVSEETGSISVAVGGMLKRHLAPETLDRLLRNELLPEPEEPKKNFNVKSFSLTGLFKGKKGATSDE